MQFTEDKKTPVGTASIPPSPPPPTPTKKKEKELIIAFEKLI